MATIRCGVCQQEVAIADADVTGLGYRCEPCSLKAGIAEHQGASDAAAHFDDAGLAEMRRSGTNDIWYGLGLAALGVAIMVVFESARGGVAIVGGGAYALWGWTRLRHASGKRTY